MNRKPETDKFAWRTKLARPLGGKNASDYQHSPQREMRIVVEPTRLKGFCCMDRPTADIDAACTLQDVVNAAQVQRRSS